MRKLSDTFLEKFKTQILCSITFFLNCAVYDIIWKNIVETGQTTYENIRRRILIGCWITKATNTHCEYVILIYFALQQLLQERASMLRYSYSVRLVGFK
jgi:hypothetical protein